MWNKIVRRILKDRYFYLSVIGLLSVFLVVMAFRIRVSIDIPPVLSTVKSADSDFSSPDEDFDVTENFVLGGVSDARLFQLENFRAWENLIYNLENLKGVSEVLAFNTVWDLEKNDTLSSFFVNAISSQAISDQADLDSLMFKLKKLPFYSSLYNPSNQACTMMILLDSEDLSREQASDINALFYRFSKQTGIETHLSGLPYIAAVSAKRLQTETLIFTLLAVCLVVVVLSVIFRSFKVFLLIALLTVSILIWSLGLWGLLGLELKSHICFLLPLSVLLIGGSTESFLYNYHLEYKKHNNRIWALAKTVRKHTGLALFGLLLVLTFFLGALVFQNKVFLAYTAGLVLVSLVSVGLFLILMIILISSFKSLDINRTRFFENRIVERSLAFFEKLVFSRKLLVLCTSVVLLLLSALGLKSLSLDKQKIVGGLSERNRLYQDMLFFESNNHGVIPLDVIIDTDKPKSIVRYEVLSQMNALQDELDNIPELSKPMSLVEALKYAKQVYNDGNVKSYSYPDINEMSLIMNYVPDVDPGLYSESITYRFLDYFLSEDYGKTKITLFLNNTTAERINEIEFNLQAAAHDIFENTNIDIRLASPALEFEESLETLFPRAVLMCVVVVLLGLLLFYLRYRSLRIVGVMLCLSVFIAIFLFGLAGYTANLLHLPTLFAICLGIGLVFCSASHYLARYYLEKRISKDNALQAARLAIGEVGQAQVYYLAILFFGALMFLFSGFAEMRFFGILLLTALVLTLLLSLLLLPVLLILFDKNNLKHNRFYERIINWIRRS